MTQTTISQNIRRNHVAATVDHDGQRLGHVILRGAWFVASRKHGSADDMRKLSQFRSVEAAVRWIEAAA